MECNMARVVKEGLLCLLDVRDQVFKKTKYWVELSTTPQEHVYRLCLYYDKVPREPWRLFPLEPITFCGSECGKLNKRVHGAEEERYWALVLHNGTLLFQEARGSKKKSGPTNSVEVWDEEVRRLMRDRGRFMCQRVVSPDLPKPLPDEFVINLTAVSLSFTSLMANDRSAMARSHGLWDIAHVEIEDPEYQNVNKADGQTFLKLILGKPGKKKGVYIMKLPPQARLELVTKIRAFQSRLGPPPPPRPGSSEDVQSRPLPVPPPTVPHPPPQLSNGISQHTQPTHLSPGASPHTQTTHPPRVSPRTSPTQPSPGASPCTQAVDLGSQASERTRSPSPTHRAHASPFRKVGLASNPLSSLGKCPTPPLPQGQSLPRLPTPGPHVKHFHKPGREEKRLLPTPPNVASSTGEHTHLQLQRSSPLPNTWCPPPLPQKRPDSQTNDRPRVLPRTPSPTQEDKSVRPRWSSYPGLPSASSPMETSFPIATTPNIVVDEFKDAAAAGNNANGSTTQEKPRLPKKKVQKQKKEQRYKNIPDSFTQSEDCTHPRTIDNKPTEPDVPYYSVVPVEKDNGAYKNSDASSEQQPSDKHVYMNTPQPDVGDRRIFYMKCLSNEGHTEHERLVVATNVKRSGSMPILTDIPDPASLPYYNIPDLKADPFYQNPSLKGKKSTRCPPPPPEAPKDWQKKPVPAPRQASSKQDLTSDQYYEEHPTVEACNEGQQQDSEKKDIMSVIMDQTLEEDSLGLPKEKWEKLLLLLCYPSPLQNDWRVLASKLDLTNTDVMVLESMRENYKVLPARYVFRYWQRHQPLPYNRQEVQRVLVELERLELAGMFEDYCTLPVKFYSL